MGARAQAHPRCPRPTPPTPCPASPPHTHAPPLSPPLASAMRKILSEDKAMVERLAYTQLPAEYSVRADLPQVQFRRLRQQVRRRGRGGWVGEGGRGGGSACARG